MWQQLCASKFEVCLFHTASLVAFFGALCVSELIVQSKADRYYRALLFQDVQFRETGVRIKL